jgi:hypothetical protein
MATTMFSGAKLFDANRPIVISSPSREEQEFPSFSAGRAVSSAGDLTIHRITGSHHGRTLLTLGRAAEHLETSRRYSPQGFDHAADVEAVHILMGLSRSVFEEFAERRTVNRRFEDWLVGQAVRVIESSSTCLRGSRRNV